MPFVEALDEDNVGRAFAVRVGALPPNFDPVSHSESPVVSMRHGYHLGSPVSRSASFPSRYSQGL